MKVQVYNTDTQKQVRIYPLEKVDGTLNEFVVIRVDSFKTIADQIWGPVTVNWPSIGDVTVKKVLQFAEGLLEAAVQADKMQQEINK